MMKTKTITFFLEKFNEKENDFYDESLDCFQIIFYSIFSRYKKKDGYDFDFPLILERPLYEILGFNYSIICKSTDKFKFHKTHSINILKHIDFASYIKEENDRKKMNIIPLLFDGHISLLFFLKMRKMKESLFYLILHMFIQDIMQIQFQLILLFFLRI